MTELLLSQEQVTKGIETQYPSLMTRVKNIFPEIDAEAMINQLQWSTNETELFRGLHRLHCFLQLLAGELKHLNISENQKFSEKNRYTLLALILIDSCKNSPASVHAFEKLGFTAVKDSVPFFFDTLRQAPQIYPIFNALDDHAKNTIKNDLFYLHQRHLQFGEIPLSALSDFTAVVLEGNHRRLQLMDAFWLLNLMGFELPKNDESNKMGNFGPTMTEQNLFQLLSLQKTLHSCLDQKTLEPLETFYSQKVAHLFTGETTMPESSQAFTARLMMLLQVKNDNATANELLSSLITKQPKLLEETANAEGSCFKQLGLQAITFTPAVLWKLQSINSDRNSNDVLSIFLKFQRALFRALPSVKDNLNGNLSIPLFAISQDKEFLGNFSCHPDYDLRLELNIGRFITLKARCVAPVAKPIATNALPQQIGDETKEPSVELKM